MADQVLGLFAPHSHKYTPTPERTQPGAVMMKVIASDSNDLVGVGRVYWIQAEELHAGGTTKRTIAAWLDPIKLARSGTDDASKVESQYLKFTRVRLEPSFAEHGQTVHLSARIVIPPDPHVDIVVVARHAKTGEMWEMHPALQGDVYETDITVDRKFPINDQAITIVAYAEIHEKPGRRKDVEHAIEVAGMLDPLKPYVYNPLLVVSRNRGEATLTVVQPSKRRK